MEKSLEKAVLLIGGNLGNREENIERTLSLIEGKIGRLLKVSSVVESVPWGFESEDRFLNCVVEVEHSLSPAELLIQCQAIEDAFGRVRNPEFYISRTMDVDILFMEEQIIEEKLLAVPHPHLHKRRFTLMPLVEILPDFVHPCLKKSVKELLNHCDDSSEVHIFEGSKINSWITTL